MITKKLVLACLLFTSLPKVQANVVDELKMYGTIAVCAAGVYVAGRLYHSMIHSGANNRYKAEFDMIARSSYHANSAKELVGYILQKHESNMRFFFFLENRYRNYPLLQYKTNLDWYINRLWVLQLFHLGTSTRKEIAKTIVKLERIRSIIERDYRFIQERRSFEESRRNLQTRVV